MKVQVKKKLNVRAVSALTKARDLQFGVGGGIKVSSILSNQKLEQFSNGLFS